MIPKGFTFNELLPDSIKNIPKFKAASQVLDKVLAETSEQMKDVLIWARIDELPEPVLDNLAWQLHIEGFEGYGLAETIEQKRAVIKESINLHRLKGTRWSVERIFELLDMEGLILEWWEEGAELEQLQPYEFTIQVEAGNRPMDGEFYTNVLRVIDELKNVRSHLRGIMTIMSLVKGRVNMGLGANFGIEQRVWPRLNLNMNQNYNIYVTSGSINTIIYSVYPLFEEEIIN